MTENASGRILLIESQYFPPIDSYKTLIKHDILQIEKYEHYQKVSYRNRCYVAGPNGRMILSVPLAKGKNQRTVMKDVRISNEEKWQGLHWKTLVSAYRRSPWFEYYEADLQELFETRFDFLLDWNMACFEWMNSKLGLMIPVTFTESYQKEVTGVTDARETILPDVVREAEPSYTQVFQERTGFIPGLSVLDLLFCEGKQSLEILQED
ncbi:WbqC family protein [Chitinophaga arvensicola]|uniref:WbqC-like protein family protein n=1 Tax=Chitinophaga arvensicola TaxID=29529 RepID=A0A1I0SAZ5_9BACT|nr:WbqC family protein [Chitinophaga arvensicola]SEW53574.1 WbqC-like protein family protein [Chitinophaga arvensicola]